MRVALGVEDNLSEAVGRRLLHEAFPGMPVYPVLRGGGCGYLSSNLHKFAQLAQHQPVIIFTDLDRAACPAALIARWTKNLTLPGTLLLRVAVREVESWVLADHEALAPLLGRAAAGLPRDPDALEDPKLALLKMALQAPKAFREGLVRRTRRGVGRGTEYNPRLCGIVRDRWDPARAAARSESLRRARIRMREFAGRL